MDYYVEKLIEGENGLIFPFECFEVYHNGRHNLVKPHVHNYIEILYCTKGGMIIVVNGIKYELNVGDMIIINSKEIHSTYSNDDEVTCYTMLKFSPEILYSTTASFYEAKYVLPFTLSSSTHQKLFKSTEIEQTVIPAMLKRILTEYCEKKYGYELAVRASICEMFLYILRSWHLLGIDLNLGINTNRADGARLQGVFEHVEKNFHREIKVEELAVICNMSYSYFSRYFKSVTNTNITEYINHVRINEALRLLTESDLNITEVAFEVGFSSSSYFIHQFKLQKGMTPKQFTLKMSV